MSGGTPALPRSLSRPRAPRAPPCGRVCVRLALPGPARGAAEATLAFPQQCLGTERKVKGRVPRGPGAQEGRLDLTISAFDLRICEVLGRQVVSQLPRKVRGPEVQGVPVRPVPGQERSPFPLSELFPPPRSVYVLFSCTVILWPCGPFCEELRRPRPTATRGNAAHPAPAFLLAPAPCPAPVGTR